MISGIISTWKSALNLRLVPGISNTKFTSLFNSSRQILHYSTKPEHELSESELKFKRKLEAEEKARHANSPEWAKRDHSLHKRYGSWNPTKRLSIQQMQDVKSLKQKVPHLKTIDLANMFHVNPEAIRRILKSNWVPNEKESEEIIKRSEKRKEKSQKFKQQLIDEIDLKKERLTYGKSVHMDLYNSSIQNDNKKSNNKPNNNINNYKNNKFIPGSTFKYKKYGSDKNKKLDTKPSRSNINKDSMRPYIRSVGDILD